VMTEEEAALRCRPCPWRPECGRGSREPSKRTPSSPNESEKVVLAAHRDQMDVSYALAVQDCSCNVAQYTTHAERGTRRQQGS
jgi:hypothetical protein